MKVKIKILFMAIFLVMILIIPNKVRADEEGIFEYSIDPKTSEVTITGVTDRNITEVVIPEMIDGKSVCIIGEHAFENCSNLQNIDFGSVKELKSYSFSNCTSLQEIEFPKDILTIGANCFDGDYNLKKINMYYNQGKMNCSDAFINSGVDTVVIEERYAKIKNLNGIEIKNVIYKNIGTIDRECMGITTIENVQIDDSITWITDNSFKNCTGLKNINLPEKVVILGKFLFDGCTSLKKINIPIGVKSAPGMSGVFINSYINHVVFDKGLTEIPEKIFAEDAGNSITIKTIEYEEGTIEISNIDNFYRYQSSVKNVIVPSTARIVANSAFYGYTSLSNIDISNINVIGQNAFRDCKSLESIVLSPEVAELKSNAFSNCINLKKIVMGDNIVKIGDEVFNGCKNLSEIVLPSKLEKIGAKAFYNCEALKQIIIPSEVTSIDQNAFFGCSNLEKVEINGQIKEIANYTFENCEKLTDISLPDSLLKIGYRSFYNCSSMSSINLPENISSIGEFAFEKNYSLKQIYLPKSLQNISRYSFNTERLHPAFKATVEYKSYAHNFAKENKLPFEYVMYNLSDCYIEGDTTSRVYTGELFTPRVYLKNENNKEVLIENDNYKLTYLNNKNAGTATILITGINNYTGTERFNFKIEKATYDMSNVKFENLTCIYDGKQHSIAAIGLPNGVSVTYQNNGKTNAGIYTITAIFTGDSINYNTIKNMTATLKIDAKNISNLNISSVTDKKYTGADIKPSVTVKDGNITLKNDSDYTLAYTNSKNTGKSTITITGQKNYIGTKKITFKIIPSQVINLNTKSQKEKEITLQWTKNGGNVTGYKVYQYNSESEKWDYVGKTSKTSFIVKKLKAGTKYKFKIRAYKTIDGTQYFGSYSSKLSTSTIPSATKIKTLTTKNKKVTVNWNKVAGATGYEVYMSTNKNKGYSRIKTITQKGTVSYTKGSLKKNKTYYFKIRTYKTVNEKKIYSSYSNVKQIKVK